MSPGFFMLLPGRPLGGGGNNTEYERPSLLQGAARSVSFSGGVAASAAMPLGNNFI